VGANGQRYRTDEILDEQNYTLSSVDLSRLLDLINNFHLIGDRGCMDTVVGMECRDDSPIKTFESNDEKDLNSLKEFLSETLPIRWATLVPDKDQCPTQGERSSHLYIDAEYISNPDAHLLK